MRSIDELLQDKAFDCLDTEVKKLLKGLYINIRGKTAQQAMPYVIMFAKSLPRGISLTKEQKNAILEAVTLDMTESEKKNLSYILNMFNF